MSAACQGQHTGLQNSPCPTWLRPEQRVPAGATHAGWDGKPGALLCQTERSSCPDPTARLGMGPGADDTGLEEAVALAVCPGTCMERPYPYVPLSPMVEESLCWGHGFQTLPQFPRCSQGAGSVSM